MRLPSCCWMSDMAKAVSSCILPLSRFFDLVGEGQHGFHLLGHLHHRIVELGADELLERLKPGLVPGQAAVLLDQLVTATGDAVVNQLGHLAKGVEVEPSLALFGSFSCRYLMGDGTVRAAPAGAGPPTSAAAGPPGSPPAGSRLNLSDPPGSDRPSPRSRCASGCTPWGSSPKLHRVRPDCSISSSATWERVSCTLPRSDSFKASRSLPSAIGLCLSSTTRKVEFQVMGTAAQSQDSRGTVTPVMRRNWRSISSSSGPCSGLRVASSASA